MKKLLTALILAFVTQVAVFAMPPKYTGPHIEIELPTAKLLRENVNWGALLQTPGTIPPTINYILDHSIPTGDFTFIPNTGTLVGGWTAGAGGLSASVAPGVGGFTLTTFQMGTAVGWQYEIAEVEGKKVILCKYAVAYLGFNGTGSFVVTPEKMGKDEYDAAYAAVTGRWSPGSVRALEDGSLLTTPGGSEWYQNYSTYKIMITTFIEF